MPWPNDRSVVQTVVLVIVIFLECVVFYLLLDERAKCKPPMATLFDEFAYNRI